MTTRLGGKLALAMTNQVTTRKCPECQTIFRHRGEQQCPHCGHAFSAALRTATVEARPAPPERPAVDEAPLPQPSEAVPPPPPPAPVKTEPVYESASELDALLMPYAENAAFRPEPPPPRVAEAHVESTIPPLELPPQPQPEVVYQEKVPVPIPGSSQRAAPPMDPVDEALAGEHLVPADSRHTVRRSKMPWYLRRETLIGLALVALVLVAVIVQLAG